MSKRVLFTIGGLVSLLVIAGAGWYFFIRSDAPDAPDAATARDALESNDSDEPVATTTPTDDPTGSSPDTAVPQPDATDVAGTWAVDPALGGATIDDRSYVGYKVEEELVRVGSSTAFGRTPEVSGTLVIEGTTARTVEIEADLTALESDQAFRDRALGSQALETDTFPTATFTLTSPIDFDGVPDEGTVVEVTAVGDLTLHGVTRSVELPLEAQLVDETIAVTGVAPVLFADFDIEPPSAPAVASVEDNGQIEIQLFFSRV